MSDVHTGFEVGAELQRVAKLGGFDRWFVTSANVSENTVKVMESLETQMLKTTGQTCDYVLAAVAKSQRQEVIKPTERVLADDIEELKNGSAFVKFCRGGRPKLRILWITEDGRCLCWGKYKGRCTKYIFLKDINGVLEGQRTPSFRKYAKGSHSTEDSKARSLSLLLSNDRLQGSKGRACVDLIATNERICEIWIRYLQCAIE